MHEATNDTKNVLVQRQRSIVRPEEQRLPRMDGPLAEHWKQDEAGKEGAHFIEDEEACCLKLGRLDNVPSTALPHYD